MNTENRYAMQTERAMKNPVKQVRQAENAVT